MQSSASISYADTCIKILLCKPLKHNDILKSLHTFLLNYFLNLKGKNMKDKPYFKHDIDARFDHRIIKIRQKYGAKGYGIYFMLIEMLRASQIYELVFDLDSLAFDIHEDKEIIQDIIKNYGLFSFRKDKFFSKSLKERMGNLDKMRENWQKKANKRWAKKAPALTPEQVRNIQ